MEVLQDAIISEDNNYADIEELGCVVHYKDFCFIFW